MIWKGVRGIYGSFAVLAALDLVLVAFVDPVRNASGRTGQLWLAIRLLLDIAVLGLCCFSYLRLRIDSRSSARLVLILSVIFGVLGLLTLTPWTGTFVAVLTPIAVLYFAAILWVPGGFFVAMAVTSAFVILNVTIGILAFHRLRKDSTGSDV